MLWKDTVSSLQSSIDTQETEDSVEESLRAQIDYLVENKNYDMVIQILEGISEEKLEYTEMLLLARCYNEKKEYTKAYHLLKRHKASVNVLWYYHIGVSLFHMRRWREAYNALSRVASRRSAIEEVSEANTLLSICKDILDLEESKLAFRDRVKDFWDLFIDYEQQLRDKIGEGAPDDEAYEFARKILTSVFKHPMFHLGHHDDRYLLAVSTGGRSSMLYKILYWNSQAPEELSLNWDFYVGIPREDAIDTVWAEVEDLRISPDDVEVWPVLSDDGRLSVSFYCHKCAEMQPTNFYPQLYNLFYRCLGEVCILTTIRDLEVIPEPIGPDAMTLRELRDYIEAGQSNETLPAVNDPLSIFSSYEMQPKSKPWDLREDIYKGSIPLAMLPIMDMYYLGATDGYFEDALDGVMWGYVYYSCENIEEEQRVQVRAELEEELDHALSEEFGVGGCVGGASGYQYSYLECIAMDLQRFIEVVTEVMRPYRELYQIKECGFSEFRRKGQKFRIDQDVVNLELDRRISELMDSADNNTMEKEAMRYLLEEKLHNHFPVEDQIVDDHIEIPQWLLTVKAEFKQMEKNYVGMALKFSHPDWDREMVLEQFGVGKDLHAAVDMAIEEFEHDPEPIIKIFTEEGSAEETEFAGIRHKWHVFPCETQIKGDMGNVKPIDFWKYFGKDVMRRLGDQKIVRVEFLIAKSPGTDRVSCSINQYPCKALEKEINSLTSLWPKKLFGVQKQSIIILQEAETYGATPYSNERIEKAVKLAMMLFHEEPYEEVLPKLKEQIEDPLLAEELYLYLPEICAETKYLWADYPETVTLDMNGEEITVYRSQLYYYNQIVDTVVKLRTKILTPERQYLFEDSVPYSRTKEAIDAMDVDMHANEGDTEEEAIREFTRRRLLLGEFPEEILVKTVLKPSKDYKIR